MNEAAAPPTDQRLLRGLLVTIALNAIVPVLLYQASKRYAGASELASLGVAALFPLGWSLAELARVRTLDPVAVLSLSSIVVSIVAVVLGGSPKLLLIRESLFTGAFGFACLISLLFPRPVLFYFARYFSAGRDPDRIAEFNGGWARPGFRHTMRVMTAVWGVTSLLEFVLRIVLVMTMTAATVLVASPVILGVLLIGTISWTFAYGRRAWARAAQSLGEEQATGQPTAIPGT